MEIEGKVVLSLRMGTILYFQAFLRVGGTNTWMKPRTGNIFLPVVAT